MALKLTYDLHESVGGFTGWINEIDGVVAMGETHQEVREELLKILRIKWDMDREEKNKERKTSDSVQTEELNLQLA